MAVNARAQIDRQRIRALIEREEKALNDATHKSEEMYKRAHAVLSGGVASSYQLRDPWPIYLERGKGPKVWDVDGNEMYDFHNGFGAMVQGHAHPAIGKAIKERYDLGTHFAAPTEDAIVVGDELARRWGLPKWRYTNSGSESTMDAIRIARAFTGRDDVLKIFGSYHGHHDTVMVSIGVDYDKIGDHDRPASLPYGAGIPQSTVDQVFAVHFNDADSMERRIAELDREGRKPACVIMEAAMMNLGVVLPEPGYLEAVRDITRRNSRGHARRAGRDRLPGGHVQREPAQHGRRARQPPRGPHPLRLRPPGRAQRPHRRRLPEGRRRAPPARVRSRDLSQGLRD